jgi:hypothetical protein
LLSFIRDWDSNNSKDLSDFPTYSVVNLAATIRHERFWFLYFVAVTSSGLLLFSSSLLKELSLVTLALS